MSTTPPRMQICSQCAYWDKVHEDQGLCRRRGPEASPRAEEVARWPQTRGRQGCGDGEAAPGGERGTCSACIFWRRYKDGMHPMNRADMPNSWWARAGVCARHAPRPVSEPGPRGFWRATAEGDRCGDGFWAEAESVN